MTFITNDLRFSYATVMETDRALVSFVDILISSGDPTELLCTLEDACDALRRAIEKRAAEKAVNDELTDAAEPVFTDKARRTESVDIEDVNVGDEIRVGGWWHRVEIINERRHGVTVKTTRNEWFAFDHGDRVTIAIGADDE